MTNPDPVQVAYDVIEDVMTPAAYDSHHGGYWLSDLPPDLLAQRIVTALRDHLDGQPWCGGEPITPEQWAAEATPGHVLEAEIQRIAAVVRHHDGAQWHECTSERECMDALRRQATPRIGGSDGQPA